MNRKGFTLIELLIVVAIIAILAMIAVPNFLEAQIRAKVTRVRTDFRNLLVAMEAYRVDNNNYPPDGNIGTSWYTDYRVQCMLTSPIAYITSVPVNPFFDIRQSQSGGPGGQTGRGSYAFWGADRHYGAANGGQDPDIRPIFWYMVSCGPNLTNEFGGVWGRDIIGRTATFVNALYDPTNGTVSYGDLIATDRGLVF
jgi:prepilin-type N-terminal cleavage/methylation domain-containing protein